MKSFKQYLSEIFDSSEKNYKIGPRAHPDHYIDHYDVVGYKHIIPGVDGEPDTEIKTNFRGIDPDHHEYGGAFKVEFSVDGQYHKDPKKEFPFQISSVVFDHINHFVQTRQPGREGLVFVADNPRKSRIYTAVAKKLNVGIRQAKDEESMRME